MTTKREFLKKLSLITVGGMLGGSAAPAFASKTLSKMAGPSKKVGLQIYSLGKELTDDVPNGMKKIADMGYSYIELAGYRDRKMGQYGMDDYRKIVEDAGLEIRSSHVNPTVREYNKGDVGQIADFWKKTVEDHVKLGAKTLVQPGMPKIENHDDAALVCDVFNQAGKIAKDAGIKWGYHNHNMEFKRILTEEDKKKNAPWWMPVGDVIYDLMLNGTDPDLVFFEMDVYWTVMGQNDPLEYFEKYPTRFPVLHIKDREVLGQSGMMNFENIFNKAYENGLNSYYVELERVKKGITQFEGVKQCFDYLANASFVRNS